MTSQAKKCSAAMALLGIASLSTLVAQIAVNTQVNTRLSQPPLSGSVRYSSSTSVPMRSELRHAYYQSGSTPSDIRMAYSQLGARTPGGPMRYIDYKPTYMAPKQQPPPPQPRAPQPTGSIRYAPPSQNMVSYQVPTARATPGPIVPIGGVNPKPAPSQRVSYAVPPAQGAVRYAR